ncbi:DMT family transporter [Paenibacillus chartarius]|uniref:DMT family transporter n=1 Tax=Paenibacillus chartarius TaxID=747481 RepID=A0ABV6DSV6_9BACL
MKGLLLALMTGFFITLQGVANSRISEGIGTWQAATMTQFTGFVTALLILLFVKKKSWQAFKEVSPVYLTSGALAAIIISSNISAIHRVGVTLTVAAVLIAQLSLTFLVDINGWFGVKKQHMRLPQFIGIALMVIGIILLNF